ncbi:MAG: hypothetical protein WBZ57_12110 [Pseudomonas graminis]
MKVKWKSNKNLKPQILMDKLAAITTFGDNGQPRYAAFEKLELDSVMLTMLDFDRAYSDSTIKRIYAAAMNQCALDRRFDTKSLLEFLGVAVAKHEAKRETPYVMVTSVSLAEGFALSKITTKKAVIRSWPKGLPKKYSTRSTHEWKLKADPLPPEYCAVTVTLKSKDPMDAFIAAMNELDYVRGLHCLVLNPESEFRFGTGSSAPLNKVMLGGMHTLHDQRGKLINKQIYWYERNYEVRSVLTVKNRLMLKKNFEFFDANMAAFKDGPAVKDAFVRYVRAFDEQDRNVTIQKAWASLESLLSPGENNADAIVRRASFLFSERSYYKQVLEHLREYRNRNVHLGYEVENLDYHCYQLQMFFKQAIFFYLRNAEFFEDLASANKFLDMPSDVSELQKLRRTVDKAILFQTPVAGDEAR